MSRIRILKLAEESLRLNAWPFGLLAMLLIGGGVASAHYGFDYDVQVTGGTWSLFSLTGLLLIFTLIVLVELVRARPDQPTAHLLAKFRQWELARRVAIGLPILLTTPLLFSAFASVKVGIPVMHPFDMDPLFVEMDRAIHGTDPWRLLLPLLQSPLAMFLINIAYHAWFFLFYGALALAAVMVRDIQLRNQFLVAFMLCWIGLGLIVATQLSSVGPVFLSAFYPGISDPYTEQMALLVAADQVYPLWALDVQAILLESARNPENATSVRGISAMPSMHVSIAVLLALFACRVSRLLGIAAILFAVVIQVGSVALAWHYAIDGYLSILLTPLIWVVSGWLVAPRPHLATRLFPVPVFARTAD